MKFHCFQKVVMEKTLGLLKNNFEDQAIHYKAQLMSLQRNPKYQSVQLAQHAGCILSVSRTFIKQTVLLEEKKTFVLEL